MTGTDERMLSPDYLDGLRRRTIEQVRDMRAECLEVETGLSYLRRMVQGPIDIVTHEMRRRASGEGAKDLADIVADLPETLADMPRPAGSGRLSQTLEPTFIDPELGAELEDLVGDPQMGDVTQLANSQLSGLLGRLRTFESKVSELRRSYFEIIDSLQAEIARRYRDGEANVESLLEE